MLRRATDVDFGRQPGLAAPTLGTMTTTRTRFGTVVLIAALAAASAGCDNAAETGIEQLIESQGGGDVDLDLSGDGDGFSIQTEDGGMTFDEDGNFVITDESGNTIVGSADDQGNVVVESEDGSFSASGDEGEFNMESDDGSFDMTTGTEIPEQWPGDVPLPGAFEPMGAAVFEESNGLSITLTGQSSDGPLDFVDGYGAALEGAGFEQTSTFESEGAVSRTFESTAWTVSVTASGVAGAAQTQTVVNLVPASG